MKNSVHRRVLLLTPFFPPNLGGVETHLTDLCNGLRKKNYFVYVLSYQPITVKDEGLSVEKGENYYVRRLWWPGNNTFYKLETYPPFFNFVYLLPGLFFLTLFFLIKNKNKIDLIHSHGIMASFIAVVLKPIFKKPVVVSTHAIYNFEKGSFFSIVVRWVFNSADRIITLSEGSKEELLDIGVKNEKVGRYTYWVNQNVFKPADKGRSKKNLELGNQFTVLFVGRLMKIKGVKILIKVAEKIGEGVNFIFIGTGPLEEDLKFASQKDKNVIFVGRVENQDLPLYYNAADLFVMPSVYKEGFGRVILEAMSCGLPVLASNMGSIPEAVGESGGIIIKPTIKNFSEKISWLYKNKRYLKELSSSALKFAKDKYSDKNVLTILQVYEQVLPKE